MKNKEQVTYFIADLHLAENRPDITACFLAFMKNDAIKAEKLYILGDLFEVWFGDDYKTELTEAVINAVKTLNSSGTKVYFIHGNRDFLLGNHYAKQANMILLPEKQLIDLYDEKVLLMHGDTLCTRDVDYQKFRKKSRSWWWQGFMKSLPLWLRKRIADNYRAKSKQAQQTKSLDIMDVTESEVVKDLEEYNCQLMIHGHTHRPNIHNLTANNGPAQRIVLGDWYEQGAWLKVTPTEKTLLNTHFN
ncbi:UDP-2,3-diacylglucosamine diphosphatase [Pseudocolwellia sp. AS88]|uniref:UDP-2,3-diacylglucosamine diphosphatase n=1 Tax=Pseudocolwellia sp. AS88 TaxID=3063958 RepID=UPI0026EB7F24|nr:UDP-2,3-diacylglucosamine diphosphatase [Pseudocolwellia sp. AS88]MDO7085322.1 UDP-2,3-diacylglucosamine diphosphatase [Pseudocolwellia sp. AS88]